MVSHLSLQDLPEEATTSTPLAAKILTPSMSVRSGVPVTDLQSCQAQLKKGPISKCGCGLRSGFAAPAHNKFFICCKSTRSPDRAACVHFATKNEKPPAISQFFTSTCPSQKYALPLHHLLPSRRLEVFF